MSRLNLFLILVLLGFSFHLGAQDFNNIEFVENKGQWDNRVRFKGDVNAGSVFIRSSGFTILQHNKDDYRKMEELLHNHQTAEAARGKGILLRSHSYNVDFVGASPNVQLQPDKPAPGVTNYLIGNDRSKWGEGCRIYQAMTLKEIYPGIDVRYYTYNGVLKYDIIARPGADIRKIAMKYEGADKISVQNKELVISTSVGELRESAPYTYQVGANGKKELSSKYVVRGNVVSFEIKGYDPASTLIIDPSLIFCSFSGSAANNFGFTATYGPDGSFFGGGIVFGAGFPVTPGALQTTYQGGSNDSPGAIDIGIIKLSANGGTRLYATYVGGSGNEQPHSLVADQQGNLILAGRTSSDNYPATNTPLGAGGGYDIVVTKLNQTGGQFASIVAGGSGADGVNISFVRSGVQSLQRNYGDDGRSEVILDGAGNVYVASTTQSSGVNGTAFPVTAGAFQPAFGGGLQDGVVMKFSPNLTPLFSSFLGGHGNDAAYVLTLSAGGDIFVAGGTQSQNFPGVQAGVIGPALQGDNTPDSIDGFIAQIRNDGSGIVRSTYLGTTGKDQIYGIQFDRSGFPYVTGQTTGNWPVVNAAYSNPGSKQFIAKLRPDLSAFVYSTVFGTASPLPNISPTAFLVDRCENVYVSGWGGTVTTGYPSSGTSGLPVTADALQSTTDDGDFYFFVLRRDAVSQLYGSFFGQPGGGFADHVDGGTSRFDPNGIIYQGVCANCGGGANFPTTPGVWAPTRPNSAFCNLGMIKIAFNLAGVGSQIQSSIGGTPRDTAGCVPLTVDFTDQVRNATEYIWNFGDDGSGPIAQTDPNYSTFDEGPFPAASGFTRSHTFNTVGTYRVMLIAINPTACNVRDTSYINISVGDLIANLDASVTKLAPCDAFNYQFNNLSTTQPVRPFTDTSFIWNFGDGSPRVVAGLAPVNHVYPGPGTYSAWLVLRDSAYCNFPDSLEIVVRVAANVEASFDTPAIGCAPYTAVFTNTSVGGLTFEWDFGDPASGANNTSTDINPTHLYNAPGTYTIRMIAIDPNTCNVRDTATFTVVVYDTPVAGFSYTPTTPIVNTPHTFRNESSANAVRFKWIFGDGDTLSTTSRADVVHQYNSTGTFDACLVAFNQVGCSDTTCLTVSTLIEPALDVPNAFTPNSNDVNSIVMVRGFGIAKMRFTIWNRWGQKVFETQNRLQGWDGKVKGVVQPMDVYAYTLDVEFFDGTKATKKGDITLIR